MRIPKPLFLLTFLLNSYDRANLLAAPRLPTRPSNCFCRKPFFFVFLRFAVPCLSACLTTSLIMKAMSTSRARSSCLLVSFTPSMFAMNFITDWSLAGSTTLCDLMWRARGPAFVLVKLQCGHLCTGPKLSFTRFVCFAMTFRTPASKRVGWSAGVQTVGVVPLEVAAKASLKTRLLWTGPSSAGPVEMSCVRASAMAPIFAMQASTPATIAGAGASVVPVGIVPASGERIFRFSARNSSASRTPSSYNAFKVRSELALPTPPDISGREVVVRYLT